MNSEDRLDELSWLTPYTGANVLCCSPGPPFQKIGARVEGLMRWIHSNNPVNSLRNVQEHYDIGNDMYKYMLGTQSSLTHLVLLLPALNVGSDSCVHVRYASDGRAGGLADPETLSYTCALWRDPALRGFKQFPQRPAIEAYKSMTLGEAQLNKIHYIIEKAGLKESDEVVELGCGWGGFSIEAAKKVGCKVRTALQELRTNLSH